MKMEDATIVKLTAIVCLSGMMVAALFKGIDSALLGTISAIIGGIAGYTIGRQTA
jgi:membrane protein YqaA with SNARE-associated domain